MERQRAGFVWCFVSYRVYMTVFVVRIVFPLSHVGVRNPECFVYCSRYGIKLDNFMRVTETWIAMPARAHSVPDEPL